MANIAATTQPAQLDREIGFWGGLSANVLNMVGVGPFITIPLALAAMGGPQAMLGWIAGALLCLCDGMVWAELGSAMPASGGPYHYLLQAFGPKSLGLLISFIFLWQSLLLGPLSIASGAVGFADYAGFLWPHLTHYQRQAIAATLCLLNTALLCRSIRSIAAISIAVTSAVVATCCWIIAAGVFHFHPALAFDLPPHAFHLSHAFWIGLGSATLIATYDYGGYNNVCLIGGEIRHPRTNIPRVVLVSILVVAVLYLAINTCILGAVPWRTAITSKAIAADYMQTVQGLFAARLVSLLILLASWGSAFVLLLGYSRIPYTAAVHGSFPRIFARVHPRGHFPIVSLLTMGTASAIACLFSLETLISVLIIIQTIFQSIALCVAVMLLRHKRTASTNSNEIYRMPLYPLPALIALAGWLGIIATSHLEPIVIGLVMAAVGASIFFVQAARKQEWPFRHV